MTREEAYNMAYEDLDSMYHSTWIRTVVDEIYNDFESRTCESCSYYGYICFKDRTILGCEKLILRVGKDFACNKWRSKDD